MSIRINISVDKIFVDKDWFVIIVIFIKVKFILSFLLSKYV